MNNNAVAAGSYADMKIVKTRSVMQVIVEIPIEQANSFVEMFGVPLPGAEIPVAIARLNEVATGGDAPASVSATPQPEAEGRDMPRQPWGEMRLSQQAGIRCNDPNFESFLAESPRYYTSFNEPGKYVRHVCGVRSRSELDGNEKAAQVWRQLDREYVQWRFENNLPEQRG